MNKKNKEKIENEPYYIFLVIVVIVSIIARVVNYGYALVLLLIPIIIYFIVFTNRNLNIVEYFGKEKNAKTFFMVSTITFLLTCILMPDSDGPGGSHGIAVFRLLDENNSNLDISYFLMLRNICYFLIVINLVTLIIESYIIIKARKNKDVINSENNTDKDINIKED
jgi:hypothetical protein